MFRLRKGYRYYYHGVELYDMTMILNVLNFILYLCGRNAEHEIYHLKLLSVQHSIVNSRHNVVQQI